MHKTKIKNYNYNSVFVFKHWSIDIQNDHMVAIPSSGTPSQMRGTRRVAFRVSLQRPNDTTPETQSGPAA